MKEKIPIIDGQGNCCPECGSLRMTIHEQRNLYVDRNLSNGIPIIMKDGKMRHMEQGVPLIKISALLGHSSQDFRRKRKQRMPESVPLVECLSSLCCGT